MVKVSINLPNSTQISFEADAEEIAHGVVGAVLRDLPRDLMNHVQAPDGQSPNGSPPSAPPEATDDGTEVDGVVSATDEAEQEAGSEDATADNGDSPPPPPARTGNSPKAVERAPLSPEPRTTVADLRAHGEEASFAEFCRSASPMGDMRRVVVAAEGANRILGMTNVDAEDLARLFDLAGWRRAHNFTQTLRNAARDRFRWLERVPGRAGRYAVTDRGRSATLDQ